MNIGVSPSPLLYPERAHGRIEGSCSSNPKYQGDLVALIRDRQIPGGFVQFNVSQKCEKVVVWWCI